MPNYIFDDFKISEILFYQILPRYPCFYSLRHPSGQSMLAHLFSRSLSHSILYAKFLDPILIDSYFSVSPTNLHFTKTLNFEFPEKFLDIEGIAKKAERSYQQMVYQATETFPYTPITLIQRIEVLRVLFKQALESYYHIRVLMKILKGEKEPENNEPARGTQSMEKSFLGHLRMLRNVSLVLFSSSKFKNWYDTIKVFGFGDLFSDVFEGLVENLCAENLLSVEKVLFFLNFPAYFRKCEVKFILIINLLFSITIFK